MKSFLPLFCRGLCLLEMIDGGLVSDLFLKNIKIKHLFIGINMKSIVRGNS
ncbi:hypothetical protein K661_01606 [Piscirickettsia salmonis LF-89 = ATCC VR-1361]|nr:hypothetical protein K661_01606 [Piscirickettsia salmonis LF-89 = ATCC VR-1361]